MSAERDLHREVLYWRRLLERVAGDLESIVGREPDLTRSRLLAARAMRIRQRLHEGMMPAEFDPSPFLRLPSRDDGPRAREISDRDN